MYVVINGGGKVGEQLAHTLLDNRHRVAIIEINEKKIDALALRLQHQILIVHGDGCDSRIQDDAGTAEADIFVATTGSDDVNLVSCEIAKLVFNAPRSIARVNSPRNERIFRRVGVEAVSSTSVISRLIESEATAGAVHAVMTLAQGNLLVTEVIIPPFSTNTKGKRRIGPAGCQVADIELPEGVLLVAVGHEGEMSIVKGSTMLYPGDTVVCVSNTGQGEKIRECLL
ncbi:MAG: TrkA family potassium uptake protein [Actinomycetia bacterium]|nr:TrkA family potassium uptake protein [Actinomycetes bacterium]